MATALPALRPAASAFMRHSPLEFAGPQTGDRFGRYTLGRRLGEGGGSVVFLARADAPGAGPIALKTIKPGLDHPALRAQFATEKRALARLDHPGVVHLIDAGESPDDGPYLGFNYIRGRRLTAHCDHARLSLGQRLHLFHRLCAALAHVHDRGVVHGDLKPANILVAPGVGSPADGVPTLIDFGLARFPGDPRGDPASTETVSDVAGTPAYMCPEQASGTVAASVASDLYAAGAVLCTLLVGRPPASTHGGRTAVRPFSPTLPTPPSRIFASLPKGTRLAVARRRGMDPATLAHALTDALDDLVLRCLALAPRDRWTSAYALADTVQRWLPAAAPSPRARGARSFPPPRPRSPTRASSPARTVALPRETPAAAA